MKTRTFLIAGVSGIIGAAGSFAIGAHVAAAGPNWPASRATDLAQPTAAMTPVLAKNLADFDDLDFHVYTGQHWENLHKSHAEDIIVYYPDGHTTKGIPAHIKELNFMWTSTLGHWNHEGTMSEEYLFWDNDTLMKQIGVE